MDTWIGRCITYVCMVRDNRDEWQCRLFTSRENFRAKDIFYCSFVFYTNFASSSAAVCNKNSAVPLRLSMYSLSSVTSSSVRLSPLSSFAFRLSMASSPPSDDPLWLLLALPLLLPPGPLSLLLPFISSFSYSSNISSQLLYCPSSNCFMYNLSGTCVN